MKVLIVLLSCIVVVLSKNCTTRLDCGDEECCVEEYYSRIRQCGPLTDEGDYCLTDLPGSDKLGPTRIKCPCKSGLFCNQTQHKCQVRPPQSFSSHCESGNDCSTDQCCVKDFYGDKGRCQKLTQDGDYCLVGLKEQSRTEVATGVCPCMNGSVCYSALSKCAPYDLHVSLTKVDEYELNNTCKKGEDCSDDTCCLYDPNSRIPGKQYCEPLLENGEQCNDDQHGFFNKDKRIYSNACPCKLGLYCRQKEDRNNPRKYCRTG